MDLLLTATTFYELGVATIPVVWRDKNPHLNHWREYQTRLPEPEQLVRWFSQPNNIGVVCGWRNLVVIDFDNLDMSGTYGKWLGWAARHPRFSVTYQIMKSGYKVRTARGIHVYVWLPQPESNRKLPGIDVQARNKYVLGEGSVHPTGALYTRMTPGMIIQTVTNLSEVLPPALLLTTEHKPFVKTPVPVRTGDDPWAYVDTPTITTGLVERIKTQLHLTDFLDIAQAQRTGHHHYLLPCPLHDDDHPSFWLDTERQICGCFAGCTAKPLDVINLYARLYGLSNQEAIFQLARLLV